jgi:putative transposase
MMFISDDFPGISDAIHSVFPAAMTQKCMVHLMRNFDRNLSPQIASEIKQKVRMIRDDDSLNFDEAVNKFDNLCKNYKDKNETFFNYLQNKKEEWWYFMKFKSDIRKYINNTNVVENFNSVLEKARVGIGGYFQSVNAAEKSIFPIVRRLHNNIWDKPNPKLKHYQHEVRQKFNLTFGD